MSREQKTGLKRVIDEIRKELAGPGGRVWAGGTYVALVAISQATIATGKIVSSMRGKPRKRPFEDT